MLPELLLEPSVYLTGVFLLGLMVGSFLNVVILRLPHRLEHDWRLQARELLELGENGEEPPPGLVFDHSRCPHCGHAIRPWENIPILSYLVLRGRCAACRSQISARYPVIEIATAILFAVTAYQLGPTFSGAAGIVMTAYLIALTGIDIDCQYLPDNLTLPLLWIGLGLSIFEIFSTPVDSILGAVIGYLSFWLVFHVFRLLTGKDGMGYGDFKLLAALGAWLGWQSLPLIIVLSSLVGAIYGVVLMTFRSHGRDQPLPFGPFIAAAGWISMLWGDRIIAAYLRFSGLG